MVLRVLAAMILAVLAAVSGVPARADPFQPLAPSVLLIDAASGSTLLARNIDTPAEPGAMTKLVTLAALAEALKAGEVKLDTAYLVTENAWRKGGAPSGGPTMFAALKSTIAVSDLLRGLAVQAGNDACIILAEGLDGSQEKFAARMTALAKRIGMAHSSFRNATGAAEPGQVSTLQDIARALTFLIESHPESYALLGEPVFTWNKIRQTNRNPLYTANLGVDGGMAAGSEATGFGLAVSAKRGEQRLILVMLGLKSTKERNDEAKRILDWAFTSFKSRQLFAGDETIGTARVFGGEAWSVELTADKPVSVLARSDGPEVLEARIVYDGPVPAPVRKGERIGHLIVTRDGTPCLDEPLFAAADVAMGGMTRRALDAIYEIGVGLVRGERQSE